MKTFLITSASLLAFVLVVVVLAFLYVQRALAPDATTGAPAAPSSTPAVSQPSLNEPAAGVQVAPASDGVDPEPVGNIPQVTEPIPLSSLPLSDAQKSILSTAGIDVATFVITPEMVVCAQNALGAERFSAIVAGDAPGATEIFTLLRCL